MEHGQLRGEGVRAAWERSGRGQGVRAAWERSVVARYGPSGPRVTAKRLYRGAGRPLLIKPLPLTSPRIPCGMRHPLPKREGKNALSGKESQKEKSSFF